MRGALIDKNGGEILASSSLPDQTGNNGKFLTTNGTVASWGTPAGSVNFADNETPSGSVNGSNTSFTLANTPAAGSLLLFLGGVLLRGGGEDYSISGTTITMNAAPLTGTVFVAFYRYT